MDILKIHTSGTAEVAQIQQIGQEGNSKLSRATSRGTPMRNFYTPYVTEEGVTVQTLLPPLPDAAEAVAGRLQRARAAVAARTRQVHGPLPMPPRKIPPRPLTAASQQLAGPLLQQAAKADAAEDVMHVQVQNKGIESILQGSLVAFTNLRHLDLAGNRLTSLGSFSTLPVLHTLLLSGNIVSSLLDCQPEAFAHLEVLDISCNAVEPQQVAVLGHFPQLRQLNISGNKLGRWAMQEGSFGLLRVLTAANCRLTGAGLHQLASLPSLTDLHLASNSMTAAPGQPAAQQAFPSLQLLDLSHNRIATVASIRPLLGLAKLQRLVLISNPVAGRSAAFADVLPQAATSQGAVVVSQTQGESQGAKPVLVIQLQPEPLMNPLIAQLLPEQLMRVQGLPVPPSDCPPGTMMFEYSHDRITEAFDRLQEDMQQWVLDLEEPVEQQQQDEGEAAPDTPEERSVSDAYPVDANESAASQQGSEEASGSFQGADVPSHITDPTIRSAIALGLDPRHLTIYSSRQGTDSASAVAALQFVLAHPLTEADEGWQNAPHFYQTTRSIAAKQRPKVRPAAVQQPDLPLSFRMDKLATIEGILAGMKSRIGGIEKTIIAQLDKTKHYDSSQADSAMQKEPGKDAEDSLHGATSLSMPVQQ